MHGSMDSVMKFARSADVHGTEKGSRRTALHKSAYWGHVDIVKYLITLGLRMDAKDVNGCVYPSYYTLYTPLYTPL